MKLDAFMAPRRGRAASFRTLPATTTVFETASIPPGRRGRSAASPRGSFLGSARPLLAWMLAVSSLLLAGAGRAGIPEPDLVWYGKVFGSVGDATVRLTTGTLVWQLQPVAGGAPVVMVTTLSNINHQFSFALRVPCESPEPGVAASTNTISLMSPAVRYRRMNVTLDGQPLTLLGATNEIAPVLADRGRNERVDLRLGIAPVDSDGDGLADSWEMTHFGSLNAGPGADPDGDGLSNLREYRAGTDPNDPASRFEIVEVSRTGSGISIVWSSQPGRNYRIRRSDSLFKDPSEYTVVQSGLLATPPLNQFIDTTTTNAPHFFYRIEIED